MNLTFRGFLREYCRELTELETDSMKKLCSAVSESSPHAAEALFLFAAERGRVDQLLKLSDGTWMKSLYQEAAQQLESSGSVQAFLASETAPERFRKVYQAFSARKAKTANDRRVIGLMREKTLANLQAKKITVYRVCAELSLNQGNVYAYLNKGDVTKVSRQTARRIMEFAASF